MFVKERFSNRYSEWFEKLTPKVQSVISDGILAGQWFDLHEFVLEPTKLIGNLFYDGDENTAAFEIGVFSAKYALKGIYKIFVKVASVDFVLKRTTSIFSTYYSEGKFEIIYRTTDRVEFLSTGFIKGDELIFQRISGWVKGIFEVISKNQFKVSYEISESENNKLVTKIISYWE